jgi:hypothetical protein
MADVDPARDYQINATRLEEIAAAARQAQVPFLVHLNGGRWAGGGPLLEKLAQDHGTMAWDRLDRPWTYLIDGEYHFSLALDNEPYRSYKRRNLQAAAAWLARFAAGPDGNLLVGVSTDSEVLLNLHPYYDYNPMVLNEYAQWLQADGPYAPNGRWAADSPRLSLRQVNERYGTRFNRWKDVGPPREKNDSAYWQDWLRFRVLLVDHSVQEQVDWIRQAGLAERQVFSHQSPALDPEIFGDTLETAQVSGGGLGITLYGEQAVDGGLMDQLKALSRSWGVFEYNVGPSLDEAGALAALDLLRAHSPRIVCPYHWDNFGGANEVGYTIQGTSFADALRDFVGLYRDQPLPGMS